MIKPSYNLADCKEISKYKIKLWRSDYGGGGDYGDYCCWQKVKSRKMAKRRDGFIVLLLLYIVVGPLD